MKLITEGNLASAVPVLPVRWCLDRAEVEELKRREAKGVHILFVVVHEQGGLEERYLEPLDRMMAYLTFRRPGNYTVFAKIVWGSGSFEKVKAFRRELLRQYRSGVYVELGNVLNETRTGFMPKKYLKQWNVRTLHGTARLVVAVPRDHFPPEPSAWLKWTANVGFNRTATDPCQFRRRLIGSPFKLIGMGLVAVITTIIRLCTAFVLAFFCKRNIRWDVIPHPWRNNAEEVWLRMVNTGNMSWFSHTKDGRKRQSRLLYLLHPALYLMLFVGVYFFGQAVAQFLVSLGRLFFWVIMENKEIVFTIVISGILLLIVFVIMRREPTVVVSEKRTRKEMARLRAEEQEYERLGAILACSAGVEPKVSALPVSQQTIRLRYQSIKAKICRPYAAQ